ncbi:MAG: addiction module toxin, HicA family [Nitrosomonas sp.]
MAHKNLKPWQLEDLNVLIQMDSWQQMRQKGNHRRFHHPVKSGTATVAGKPSVDVPSGTLINVLKQAGLKK